MATAAISLAIVAAGNGWWVRPGAGPASIATYAFVDVEHHPELLDLPGQAVAPEFHAQAMWLDGGRVLRIEISGPVNVTLELATEQPELEAVRRARTLLICPTTPALGIDPYRARDHSIAVELP